MHEMSLVRNIVDIVLDQVREIDVTRVTKVKLGIGQLRDVVDEYVPGLFRLIAKNTVAQDAAVEIIRVPPTARCSGCGFVVELDPTGATAPVCPRCGATTGFSLMSGREFMVLDIEVEMSPTALGRAS